jgi:hypothetical protein
MDWQKILVNNRQNFSLAYLIKQISQSLHLVGVAGSQQGFYATFKPKLILY